MKEYVCVYSVTDYTPSFSEFVKYEKHGISLGGPVIRDNFGRVRQLEHVEGTKSLYRIPGHKYYFKEEVLQA